MAEQSDDISGPESLWDQCEAFGTTLTDLRQYADVGKPLGPYQVQDIVMLGKALKPFAWVIIRYLTNLSDGAPWTENKYVKIWEDLNWWCREPIDGFLVRVPNPVILRMASYNAFLKTIRSVQDLIEIKLLATNKQTGIPLACRIMSICVCENQYIMTNSGFRSTAEVYLRHHLGGSIPGSYSRD